MKYLQATAAFVAAGMVMLSTSGCDRKTARTDGDPVSAGGGTGSSQSQNSTFKSKEDYQKAKEEALAESLRSYEQRMANPPSNAITIPLPNYGVGDGRPTQNYLNFYMTDECFSAYLLCDFPVSETTYQQSKEPEWFKRSLEQIRLLGRKQFPPFERVAVCIQNNAEHKGASTFEKSFKVAAIFEATNVFDTNCDLSQLVSHADMDRHPFYYDTTRPSAGEQQRWLIVERDAAKRKKLAR